MAKIRRIQRRMMYQLLLFHIRILISAAGIGQNPRSMTPCIFREVYSSSIIHGKQPKIEIVSNLSANSNDLEQHQVIPCVYLSYGL
ncbi:hypothetical protein PSV09DRAFT_2312292 [Bipolaris maydis]|nr:hypothetical protein PSV09DRAFT_2312292 [Bipolaris maydis]